MHVSQLRDKEVEKLKQTLKRTVLLAKAIWAYRDIIEAIKDAIASEDLSYASGMWNDLDYKVQKLLITAPRYGGAFTTEERAIVRGFWDANVEMMES